MVKVTNEKARMYAWFLIQNIVVLFIQHILIFLLLKNNHKQMVNPEKVKSIPAK